MLNPATPLSAIEWILPKVDMVLIMSVNPGFGGQKLIPYTVEKVRALKKMIDERGLKTDIEVDGGVNLENVTEVMDAGANIIGAGDFDSASSEALDYFGGQPDISWIRLNPVKDDTDTESAIRKAIVLGAEKITLLGATGTRIDHLLGNIELLGIGLQNHIPIQIVDERNRIRMIGAGITLEKEKQFGKFVSLIPYTNVVKGLTLTGFKYPLDHYDFKGFCSLGVSNEIIAESAQITFEDGILIVIEARD